MFLPSILQQEKVYQVSYSRTQPIVDTKNNDYVLFLDKFKEHYYNIGYIWRITKILCYINTTNIKFHTSLFKQYYI